MGQLHATTYVATKGAITAFSKALAVDEAAHDVRVNCVSPGQRLDAALAGGDRPPRAIPREDAARTARRPSSWAAWARSRRPAASACSSPPRRPSRPASTTSCRAAPSSPTAARPASTDARRPSMNRRRFVATTLGSGAALALGPRMAPASALGANDRIRVGVIGTGGRARGLMRQLKDLPGCEIVAVCDVYEPRMLAGGRDRRRAGRRRLPDYRRMLDDKEIDAVLIGTPGPLAQDDRARRASPRARTSTSRSRSRTRIEEGVGDGASSSRGLEADRADRDAAAQLGALHPRQADRRLGQARPDHLRPHLLVPAHDAPGASAGVDRRSSTGRRWLGSAPDQPFRARALLPAGGTSGTSAAAC